MSSSFGNEETFTVSIGGDEAGYLGQECPQPECEGYFKVTPGTGLQGSPTCFCPYCGYEGPHDEFHTKEQIEYAKSVVLNQFSQTLVRSLKQFESRPRSRRDLFSISLEVKGNPYPIHYYREKELETEVVCDNCTLRYAIYGVFAYCPDCGFHNTRQILEKNLELAGKELALSESAGGELATFLVHDALENHVSAFDGFGREVCRISASKSSSPAKAEKISFQNLTGARDRVLSCFGVDLAGSLTPLEWAAACRSFQKRHLISHKMGVVDREYLEATNDPDAVLGRKIFVPKDEVEALGSTLRKMADHLIGELSKLPWASRAE